MTAACAAAFLAGAAAMALELLGSRWLAPAFGASLATWALLISVTLLAGSAGAWWGGRWSERGSWRRAGGVFLAAAAWVAALAFVAPALVDALVPLPPAAGAALAALAIVGPPVAALGALVPLLLGLSARIPAAAAGRAAGALIAASTAGSLAGTLATAFLAIPELGLRRAAGVLAAVLGASGAAAILRRRRTAAGAAAAAMLAIPSLLHEAPPPPDTLVREAPSGTLTLERTPGATILRLDGITQAALPAWPPPRGGLVARRQYFELLPYLHPEGRDAVEVGLGGGLWSRCLSGHGIRVTTIEVDPVLAAVVRSELGVAGPVLVGDGRAVLRRLDARFDFALLDAFRGESLPAHLFTVEAFREVRARLRAGGILGIHLIGWPDHEAVRAVARTLREAFRERLCVRSGIAAELQDLFLFASDRPLAVPPHPELADAGWLGNEVFQAADAGAPVLTDDRNPLDVLHEPLARALRRAARAGE